MNATPILIGEGTPYPALASTQALRRTPTSQVRVTFCYLASSAPVLFPTWRFELGVGDLRLPGIAGGQRTFRYRLTT